jgi:hypothetical protein
MSYTPLDDKARNQNDGNDMDDILLIGGSINRISNKAMNDTMDDESRRALSEPLTMVNGSNTGNSATNLTESHQLPLSADPFYVFRDDLYRQLSRVDETLSEYLRVVNQTVRLSSFPFFVLFRRN